MSRARRPGLPCRPKRPVSCYLVTLEQEGLLQHQVVTPKGELKDMEIPIKAEYGPNVYVSVLALTPRGEFPVFAGRYDTEAPGYYWGNLNLPVRLEVEQLQVQISPGVKDLRAEPGANVTLDFTALDKKGQGVEAELAVAVVDEAVLALTGFKTPTLEQLTRFDGPLGVFTGEVRAFLLHQTPYYLARNDVLTGGGGLNAAMVAKLRRRFEPVAYFNPALRTDAARPGPGLLYPAGQHDQLPGLRRGRQPGRRLRQPGAPIGGHQGLLPGAGDTQLL